MTTNVTVLAEARTRPDRLTRQRQTGLRIAMRESIAVLEAALMVDPIDDQAAARAINLLQPFNELL